MSDEKKRGPNATSFGPGRSGNPGGRPKGIERMTRDEIEAFTYDFGEPFGVLSGWKALRLRAFLIAMKGEDKDSATMIKWLHDRGYGLPKQAISIEEVPYQPLDMSALTDAQVEALATLPLLEVPDDDSGLPH